MGIKPLFYFYDEEDLIFASELKAFCDLELHKKINYDSIYAYLHLGYIPSKIQFMKRYLKLDLVHILNMKIISSKKYLFGLQKVRLSQQLLII